MDWLFARPSASEANHWLAIVSLVAFAVGVIGASILSTRPGLPPFNSKYTQRFVIRACTIVGWISGIGLFFGLMRLLQIDPGTLGRPIWIVITWIVLIASLIWIGSQAAADREQRQLNEGRMQNRKGAKPTRKPAA